MLGHSDRERDHEEEEQEGKGRVLAGSGPITQDEHGDPNQNDQGCDNGKPIRVA